MCGCPGGLTKCPRGWFAHTLATPLPHPCLRGTQKANPDSQKGSIESFPLCIMLPVILVGFTDELILWLPGHFRSFSVKSRIVMRRVETPLTHALSWGEWKLQQGSRGKGTEIFWQSLQPLAWMRNAPRTGCALRIASQCKWREKAIIEWSPLLLAATVRSFGRLPFGLSYCNTTKPVQRLGFDPSRYPDEKKVQWSWMETLPLSKVPLS